MSDVARRPARSMTVCELEGLLVRTALATACVCALACLAGSHLLWNWTPSLPLGLYWVSPRGEAKVGALVAFPVPPSVRALVRERQYLPPGALLVKPIVAAPADDVCTDKGTLTVHGAPLGAIATEDT